MKEIITIWVVFQLMVYGAWVMMEYNDSCVDKKPPVENRVRGRVVSSAVLPITLYMVANTPDMCPLNN